MTKEEFDIAKAAIIQRLGPPEYDMKEAVNESAKQLGSLKGKYLADIRFEKAKGLRDAVDNTRQLKSRDLQLNAISLSETDLKGFSEKEIDVLIAWFEDKRLSPKQLANRFGVSYQFVNALLRDKRVQVLDAKYFQQVLNDNTKIALLKLTQNADPKITLAAAEYLKLMQDKQSEGNGSKVIEDVETETVLRMVGDWLVGDRASPFVLTKETLANSL